MNPTDPPTSDFAVLDALLQQALDLPPEQRQAFAERACAGDSARLAALQGLLLHCADTDSDWQHVAADYAQAHAGDAEAPGPQGEAEGFPARLGPWQVLRPLGSGGMAEVALAERQVEGVRQLAALKLLAGRHPSPELLLRFEREARILAGLSDPRIARFYDAGLLDDGRPWLAMEYVDGLRLDHWCDRRRLSIEARIRLAIEMARAIASAHARLVVHRDIKPANVLVDAAGSLKVLDFGIAKILDESSEDSETRTQQRLLTLQYASPEQLLGEAIGTASDVYQIGLVLYELCAATRPFAAFESSLPRLLRALAEQDAPAPLLALRRDLSEADIAQAAEARGCTPSRLGRWLSGDLQQVLAKTLRRHPGERYASVAQLVEDLENLLAGRPVTARAPSWSYRMRRLLARHPVGSTLAAALLLAVAAGVGATWWQMREAVQQRDHALAEARKSARLVEFLTTVFADANPTKAQGETVPARAVLDAARARIDRELPARDSVRADLLAAMASAYGGLALREPQLRLAQAALEIERELARPQVLVSRLVLTGGALRENGDATAAMALLAEAEALHRADPESSAGFLGYLLYLRALTEFSLGDREASQRSLEEAMLLLQTAADSRPRDLESVQLMLARRWAAAGRKDEAIELVEQMVASIRNDPQPRPLNLIEALDALGGVRRSAGQVEGQLAAYREAFDLAEQSYDGPHLDIAILAHNLALALEAHGDPGAAVPYTQKALEIAALTVGPGHKFVAAARIESLRLRCRAGDRTVGQGDWEAAAEGVERFPVYTENLERAKLACVEAPS